MLDESTMDMPENRGIDPLSRVLGGIEAALATVVRTQAEDRISAASYRTDIRKEFGEMRDDLTSVKTDLKLMNGDVREMKPKVVSLEQRALMSAGAARFAVVLGKGAHILSALLGGIIAWLLDRWVGR